MYYDLFYDMKVKVLMIAFILTNLHSIFFHFSKNYYEISTTLNIIFLICTIFNHIVFYFLFVFFKITSTLINHNIYLIYDLEISLFLKEATIESSSQVRKPVSNSWLLKTFGYIPARVTRVGA
jgi:hypothetical protein